MSKEVPKRDKEGWLDDDDYSLKQALVWSALTNAFVFGLALLIID